MLRFSVFFAFGALVFHQLARLPGWPWLGAELALCLLAWHPLRNRPILALLAGYAWSHAFALITLPPLLPEYGQVMQLVVQGQVVSLPERSQHAVRFVFAADRIDGPAQTLHGAWRLRLSWRNPAPIRAGETWRLPVRVRAAHGYAAPGAWDYEGWLYWQGIRYTGYVSADAQPERLPVAACCWLTRLRAAVGATIDAIPASYFARGVMRAITIGDQSALPKDAKVLFRATGTSHLMAISGLHIGLLAGVGLFVVSAIWRRVPALCARMPARLAGAVAALLAATIYAALAGMGLPTQRALIMLLVFSVGMLARRETGALHALAVAAMGVLIWHPPSIVSASFWLSFTAVLAILAVQGWTRGEARWRQAIRLQLAISLALWPLLVAFDMPASGIAPLVNLVLVPVFGVLIVPASLAGAGLAMLIPALGSWTLLRVGEALDLIRHGLMFAGAAPGPGLAPFTPGVVEISLLMLAVGLLLAPPGVPMRWFAVPMLLATWLPRASHLGEGDFSVHLLDVGQGLSTVVQTRHRTLVFDTGPEFPSGFSTAAAVVVPFLLRQGRQRVDRLVLSHGDKDHAGGVDHLLSTLDVQAVQSGEPGRVAVAASHCAAGETWQWDGVEFAYLHPAAGATVYGNNASCVLRITNAAGAVLLTGDIEQRVERQLARSDREELRSHVVVAPHHGSRTSSSAEFVAATQPAYVLYAAGWANRYGFPASSVDQRWREAGARALNTASMGTIGLHFAADGGISVPSAYRQTANRFWRHDGGLAETSHAVSSAD